MVDLAGKEVAELVNGVEYPGEDSAEGVLRRAGGVHCFDAKENGREHLQRLGLNNLADFLGCSIENKWNWRAVATNLQRYTEHELEGVLVEDLGVNPAVGDEDLNEKLELVPLAGTETPPDIKEKLITSRKVWVDKYEKERHVENEKNSPYEYTEKATTLEDVQLKLATEECNSTGDRTEAEQQDTPSTFILMGLNLEEMQYIFDVFGRDTRLTSTCRRQLAVFIKAAGPNLMMTQQLEILKRRTQGAAAFHAVRAGDAGASREGVCKGPGWGGGVATGWGGAGGLRMQTAMTRFKVRNWNTWSDTSISLHTSSTDEAEGSWDMGGQAEDDVHALNERSLTDEEAAEREQLREVGQVPEEGSISAMGDVVSGETHQTLSWIWYAASDKEGSDEKLHEDVPALRVEWCKVYSRSNRWREDLVILEEEMRRTIVFSSWAEKRWITRAGARMVMLGTRDVPISSEVKEEVRAYALEHADREHRTNARLVPDWAPICVRAAEYLWGGGGILWGRRRS
ncbi:hypothetical protein DFH09DRAFT_1073632 [Mycena vulgaris]|nr:hypothetical protein DFH09DRAFT_1073632 [Mycena vulgaris]